MVLFNLNNPAKAFLQEKNLRQALLMGLNRQWMVDAYLGGQGIVADSVILPGTWAYYEGVDQISYDPRAAGKILDDTGYVAAGGEHGSQQRTTYHLLSHWFTRILNSTKNLAETIQAQWQELGVEVNLEAVPMKPY